MIKVRLRRNRYHQIWSSIQRRFKSVQSSKVDPRKAPRSSTVPRKRTWPAPMQPPAHHGLIGEFIRIVESSTEADTAALIVQFLVAFGNAIGRKAFFQVEADKHYMNLFTVLVGRSSKARKGTSWNRIKALFESVDPEWADERVQSGLSSGEGLIYAVRDPKFERDKKSKKIVARDPGVKDKRILAVESEFASVFQVMKRDGNTLSTLLRNGWDGKKLQTLTRNDPLTASKPHISIIGHITETELKRHLQQTEAANGFANRFLWMCIDRPRLLPHGGHVDKARFSQLCSRLRDALEFAKAVGRMSLDEKAKKRWTEIYYMMDNDRDDMYAAMTARGEPQIIRMACIYALLDKSKIVRLEHLEAAYAVWQYADASVAYLFSVSFGGPAADAILAHLMERPGGMTRSEISNIFRRHKSAQQLSEALERLSKRGLARCQSEGTDGRPIERWFAV